MNATWVSHSEPQDDARHGSRHGCRGAETGIQGTRNQPLSSPSHTLDRYGGGCYIAANAQNPRAQRSGFVELRIRSGSDAGTRRRGCHSLPVKVPVMSPELRTILQIRACCCGPTYTDPSSAGSVRFVSPDGVHLPSQQVDLHQSCPSRCPWSCRSSRVFANIGQECNSTCCLLRAVVDVN